MTMNVPGFLLQREPHILVLALPGRWLLQHTTPSWRIKDPEKGFQRLVKEVRAREIAVAVLEQRRNFPNAIVLATDRSGFHATDGIVEVPEEVFFLVVDGQHRLWAQRFSEFEATYACVVHLGLGEVEMARLFLEINDNQKRVPSSLRWDLVRLVRPDDDPSAIAAAELVYLLATDDESPLFQRIDLTGEQAEIALKQGSLAPEIRRVLRKREVEHLLFERQYELLVHFFVALRDRDVGRWGLPDSVFYKARVIRALLRLIPEMIVASRKEATELGIDDFYGFFLRINEEALGPDAIRAAQGSAGIKAIEDQLRSQMF